MLHASVCKPRNIIPSAHKRTLRTCPERRHKTPECRARRGARRL